MYRTHRQTTDAVATATELMNEWELAVSDAGCLRIAARCDTLDHETIGRLSRRLSDDNLGDDLGCIELDLGTVQTIGPRWTLVLAALIRLARETNTTVRIVAINDQPAAAALLYRQSPELMALFATATAA